MTIERLLKLPSDPNELQELLQSPSETANFMKKIEIGNVRYEHALHYVNGTNSKPAGLTKHANVFEAGTPGVLSLAELDNSIELGQWKVRVGSETAALEVRT